VRVYDRNWMQLEEYLARDDRIVLPLGSTEQHAYLSLGTDSILAERVAVEAAEPLGVPVLPALPYGLTPNFGAYPGSPTLRLATLVSVLRDLLDSLHDQGFRRFLLVNGHGGNAAATAPCAEWARDRGDAEVIFHGWWNAAGVRAAIEEIDPVGGHASWFENFPWTRLEGVEQPREQKPAVDVERLPLGDAAALREVLGDGSFGGLYQRPDEDVLRVWEAGVAEVRELLETGWRRA
jgi:creatinine amidohydrolase